MSWMLGVSILLAFIVYFPALSGPFVFDDLNQRYSLPSSPNENWRAWIGARPLLQLSFFANHFVTGNNPFPYHVVNIILHGVNAFLVLLVIRHVLTTFQSDRLPLIPQASLMGAGIFLLHPAQSEAVAYVSSRSDLLSGFGFLVSLESFLRFRPVGISWLRAAWIGFAFIFALGCKEHVAVLPAVFLVAEFLARKRWPSVKSSGAWRLYALLVALGMMGGVYLWTYLKGDPSVGRGALVVHWYEYMFSQWPIFWRYIGVILFPWNLNADYDLPVLRSPFDGGAIFFLIVLLALFAWFAKWAYARCPAGLFGVILAILVMAPTSSIVPIKDLMAERRLYLAIAGLSILAAAFLVRLPLQRFSSKMTAAAVAACLSLVTLSRANTWGDAISLWKDTTEKSPQNFRAYFWLGYNYLHTGRCPEASAAFTAAERLKHDPDAQFEMHRAMAFDCVGRYPQAINAMNKAIQIGGASVDALVLRASYLAKISRFDDAYADLDRALKLNPQSLAALSTRGLILYATGRLQEAMPDLTKARELAPEDPKINQALADIQRRLAAAPAK